MFHLVWLWSVRRDFSFKPPRPQQPIDFFVVILLRDDDLTIIIFFSRIDEFGSGSREHV
jgi:hypothetical protein